MLAEKPSETADLGRSLQFQRLRSLLTFPHRGRISHPTISFLEEFCQVHDLASRVQEMTRAYRRSNREVGIALQTRVGPLLRPFWGKMVVGSADEIHSGHDPEKDYFSQRRGHLPLLMIHVHPSGRLGFSRADCLVASQVIREAQRYVAALKKCFRPIFAVAVKSARNTTEVLMVQRQQPGHFMHFHEIAQNYDKDAWLACPEFNAAHLVYHAENKDLRIIADTGIIQPLV